MKLNTFRIYKGGSGEAEEFFKKSHKTEAFYPHAFFKKRRGYCNRLRPSVRPSVCPFVRLSVRPSVRLSVMLSPPKPLDEIQPNLVCELLT